MDRRRLLGRALSATASMFTVWRYSPHADAAVADEVKTLLRALKSPSHAARLGRAYLAVRPNEADVELLLADLHFTIGDARRLATESDDCVRLKLQFRYREEFADGLVASVDGWMLSLTEAKLCALASLVGN